MIELLIKGPRKDEIIKSLRRRSQSQKQKLHMLRLKAASLKQYRTKQFIEITLSKQLIQKRKNDLPKLIPVSLVNKIRRKSSLTNIEVNNLLKLSPDKKTYGSNKKSKFKSYVEDFWPLYYSKQLRDIGYKRLQTRSKQSIITVLGQKKQRNFSFSTNKRYLQQKQRTKSVTIGSIQNSDKQFINDLKTQKFVKKNENSLESSIVNKSIKFIRINVYEQKKAQFEYLCNKEIKNRNKLKYKSSLSSQENKKSIIIQTFKNQIIQNILINLSKRQNQSKIISKKYWSMEKQWIVFQKLLMNKKKSFLSFLSHIFKQFIFG